MNNMYTMIRISKKNLAELKAAAAVIHSDRVAAAKRDGQREMPADIAISVAIMCLCDEARRARVMRRESVWPEPKFDL